MSFGVVSQGKEGWVLRINFGRREVQNGDEDTGAIPAATPRFSRTPRRVEHRPTPKSNTATSKPEVLTSPII